MSEWKEYKVEDFCEVIGGGTPSTKEESYYGGSFSWITPRDLTNHKNRFISKGERNITELGLRNSSARMLPKNSILLTSRAPIGYLAIAENEVCTNQGFKSLIVNPEKADYNFVYYLIKSNVERIKGLGTGTTFAEISGSVVKNLKFFIPSLPTQTAIAEILSSLDDKIELNNKINQELETLAQILFKQWFIDFEFPNENGEPYKSSGGEMVESELGEIPKGWEVYAMNDLLETVSKTYPLKKVKEVIFLNTGDIQDGKFLHKNLSNTENLPGQAKKSILENDILYSEIRPANKRFAYVYFNASQYVVSTKLMVMRSKVEINSLFQYFYLTQKEVIEYLQQLAESRSGTFPQITFSEVSTIKIALPNFDLVNTFVEIALKPYYNNQFCVEEENESLTKLRDTLLPKLISGELEVSNK
jgi:type I restriction enzyme, S subunit